jgi:hypothetical protein
MSRWLPMTALLAALILPFLVGCGPSSATGSSRGATPSSAAEKPAESGKATSKADDHHTPGYP